MKLIVAIVNNEDSRTVQAEITKAGYQVTKLSTSGGFLRAGNVTFLCGVDDEKVGDVVEIINEFSRNRRQTIHPTATFAAEALLSAPIEVTVGGATVFVLDVEQFYKL